jgi:rRNA maturation protein Nop10
MRKITKKITRYQCSICKTKYETASKAEKCENMPVEEPAFKIGDRVKAIEPRSCTNGKSYTMRGIITKISKSKPPDEEYEIKWLGGKKERLSSHVREYIVKYTCPRCGEIRTHMYFAPELKLLK